MQHAQAVYTRCGSPLWSPDGQEICFMGNLPDGKSRIVVVNAQGQEKGLCVLWPREDLEDSQQTGNYFAWSPDGKEIIPSRISFASRLTSSVSSSESETNFRYFHDFAEATFFRISNSC
jgi:hypothetical protein